MTPKLQQPTQPSQAGFTLLEILLVIVMIAVTAAIVVPSIYISDASLTDETRRLRIVMRMAMEESQLSATPLRWLANKQGWSFESLKQGENGNEWLPFTTEIIKDYALPEGITIVGVEQASDFTVNMAVSEALGNKDEPVVIGIVLLLPDGTTSLSNISLMHEGQDEIMVLLVRPGPSGIRLKKDTAY